MKIDAKIESALWTVLQEEGLGDLSRFHRSGFFDEVPLFSRFEQVSFLEEVRPTRGNRMLLEFGLKVLSAIAAYDCSKRPFFAALTFWDEMAAPWLVPHLFVCCGEVNDKVRGKLTLAPCAAPFSLRMERWLTDSDPDGRFQIYEDRATEPNLIRVVIGHREPLFPQMTTVDSFVTAPKRRKARSRAG
jgi:hypothetical protein